LFIVVLLELDNDTGLVQYKQIPDIRRFIQKMRGGIWGD